MAFQKIVMGCCSLLAFICSQAIAGDAERGRTLFEQSFSQGSQQAFNAKSCVECHRMGGIGGAGNSQFNARSVGIETLRVPGNLTNAQLAPFVASLYPGLVSSDGTISTVSAVPHFGGTSDQRSRRAQLMKRLEGQQSRGGGPASQSDLEAELASEVEHVSVSPMGDLTLTAKTFHRNTPPLFGAGLIDSITDEQIIQQSKLQRRNRNVSGRPATLSGGGIGRFGWRGNMATLEDFTRQACENELGLTVNTNPLAIPDPAAAALAGPFASRPVTSNVISMQDVQSLTAFLKSLPAPVPVRPEDPTALEAVVRGEQWFDQVGCSVCHVQTLGPAENLYSDMLLHDMGESMRGPSTADPYIYGYDEVVLQPTVVPVRTYYGRSVPLSTGSPSTAARSPNSSGSYSRRTSRTRFFSRPYQKRPAPIQFFPIDSREFVVNQPVPGRFSSTRRVTMRQVKVRRNLVRPTDVSQEWRTAPLWGLRDSAPYMHDGRAATVEQAIEMHDGEGESSRRRYQLLKDKEKSELLAFLDTFAAPGALD